MALIIASLALDFFFQVNRPEYRNLSYILSYILCRGLILTMGFMFCHQFGKKILVQSFYLCSKIFSPKNWDKLQGKRLSVLLLLTNIQQQIPAYQVKQSILCVL